MKDKNLSKNMICIECPKGCVLVISKGKGRKIKVTGHTCVKGVTYAVNEIKNPTRILTSTVLTLGLPVKMLPVRTVKPIPKNKLLIAMKKIKKVRVKKSVNPGDIIIKNILGLKINVIATRSL
ncbi:MAG: DUF1667 domain-containing protein [bacterium]